MDTLPADHFLVLDGEPRQRGFKHGTVFRSLIREHVRRWKNSIQSGRDINPEEYIQQLLSETHFEETAERWTPDVLEEVRGIAEGAKIDFSTILALQLMDEEWWWGFEKMLGKSISMPDACSGFGVNEPSGRPVIIGQNMDLPGYFDGLQVLLHIRQPETDHQELVFSAAGLIALNGMNNRGIGVCCNVLFQLNHSPEGLPVAFVLRGILSQSDYLAALTFIRNIQHASGQNYILGGPDYVSSIECSANRVVPLESGKGIRICHTNHPLVSDDLRFPGNTSNRLPGEIRTSLQNNQENSMARMESIERRVGSLKTFSLEGAKAALSAQDSLEHPVCRPYRGDKSSMTVGCSIMVCSDTPELIFAPGPPCCSSFQTFQFQQTSSN